MLIQYRLNQYRLNQYARYATTLLLLMGAGLSRADFMDELVNGITTTSADLSFRLHYEDVNTDRQRNASGATLQSRLRIETGEFLHSQFTVELENISTLTGRDFSNGVRNEGTAVIADPDVTEFNQVYFRFNGIPRSILQIGRQVIQLDNDRFIGDVGFRQNQQTYDAISLLSKPVSNVSVYYAHLRAVNTIFGRKAANGKQHHNSDLLNIQYQFSERMDASAYHYRLENEDVPGVDHNTTGLRFSVSWPMEMVSPGVNLEFARQSTRGTQPSADTNYQLLEASIKRGRHQLIIGNETLGASKGVAFQTPLATLHKFQGFTDQFLTTPADGLKDEYVTYRLNLGPGRIELTAHDFESDRNNRAFGKEHSIGAWYRIGDRGKILVKWARFDGARHSGDIRKYWLQLSYDL